MVLQQILARPDQDPLFPQSLGALSYSTPPHAPQKCQSTPLPPLLDLESILTPYLHLDGPRRTRSPLPSHPAPTTTHPLPQLPPPPLTRTLTGKTTPPIRTILMPKDCTVMAAAPSRNAWTPCVQLPVLVLSTPSNEQHLLPLPVREGHWNPRLDAGVHPMTVGWIQVVKVLQ